MTDEQLQHLAKLDALPESEATMSDNVTTTRAIDWRFQTHEHRGTCRLARDTCRIVCTYQVAFFSVFPDVCAIEEWTRDTLEAEPTTAEEFAVACADRWQLPCEVLLESHLHGPITCKAYPEGWDS